MSICTTGGLARMTAALLPTSTSTDATPVQEPPRLLRYEVRALLLHELGDSEQTQHLLDYLQKLWETTDLLVQRFGPTRAHAFIDAPVRLRDEEPDHSADGQEGDDDNELCW